jgi:hypothetical protein
MHADERKPFEKKALSLAMGILQVKHDKATCSRYALTNKALDKKATHGLAEGSLELMHYIC